MRLIRSKGVGVYFVTQNPLDIPDKVLGQLGNRVQHALRAFTPRDQKAVKTAAETMRANPKIDAAQGDHRTRRRRGAGVAARCEGHTRHHRARVGARARLADRPDHAGGAQEADRGSVVAGTYEKTVDRESAYEQLKARAGGGETLPEGKAAAASPRRAPSGGGFMDGISDILFGSTGPRGGTARRAWSRPPRRARRARSARRWRARSRAACWVAARWFEAPEMIIDLGALESLPLAASIRRSIWSYPVLEALQSSGSRSPIAWN